MESATTVTNELRRFASLVRTLYRQRSLIWQLAVHDLRSRYASTLLGGVWAIVSPAVTLLVFWFVSTRTQSVPLGLAVATFVFALPPLYHPFSGMADYWKDNLGTWLLGSAAVSS